MLKPNKKYESSPSELAAEAISDGQIEVTADGTIFKWSKSGERYETGKGMNARGYRQVGLYDKDAEKIRIVSVHIVVQTAIGGVIPEDMTVNHKNHDKSDNSAGNLELMSMIDNVKDSWCDECRSYLAENREKRAACLADYESGLSCRQLSEKYGVSCRVIYNWLHLARNERDNDRKSH